MDSKVSFVGRLTMQKGIDIILEASQLLICPDKHPSVSKKQLSINYEKIDVPRPSSGKKT